MDKQRHNKNGETGNNMFHRMIGNQIARGIGPNEESVSCNTPRNSVHSVFTGPSGRAAACTNLSQNIDSVSSSEYVRDPGSILSLQPWIFRKSGFHNNGEMIGSRVVGKGKNLFDGLRDSQAVEVSPRSPSLGSGHVRGCGALRSRRHCRHLIKPLAETENSYIPQLYSENFEIEECTFAPVPSPASMRPFVVTDGRRVISKSRYEPVPFNIGFDKEECLNGSRIPGSLIGIAPLPELKKLRQEGREPHNARLGLSGTRRSSKAPGQAGNSASCYKSNFILLWTLSLAKHISTEPRKSSRTKMAKCPVPSSVSFACRIGYR
jgi:hypothetical protein